VNISYPLITLAIYPCGVELRSTFRWLRSFRRGEPARAGFRLGRSGEAWTLRRRDLALPSADWWPRGRAAVVLLDHRVEVGALDADALADTYRVKGSRVDQLLSTCRQQRGDVDRVARAG
jgi:hypothetical protein